MLAVAAAISVLVVVGGITRLTGSGLSITRWDLVRGTLPPLSDAAWRAAFDAYRESPQYRLVNAHFDLDQFRQIFWWEWIHRLIGRALVPLLLVPWIAWRKQLPAWLHGRLALIVALVLLQGALGWFMVASGLVDVPQVSHFRLAAHLSTALVTFSVVVWTALDLARGRRGLTAVRADVVVFALLLALQIVWGAFVAGLDAGAIHPTWPRIGGQWFPEWAFERGWPWAITHHPTAVQLVHRTNALLVVLAGWTLAARVVSGGQSSRLAGALGAALGVQLVLGIITVLRFGHHPVLLGSLHQSVALLLVAMTVVVAHCTARGFGSATHGELRSPGEGHAKLHATVRV